MESKGGFTYSSKNPHEEDALEEGELMQKVGRGGVAIGRPRNSMDDDEEYNA